MTLSELSAILLLDKLMGTNSMARKISDRGIPPYLGWAAWNRLVQAMKAFIPPRLDRSYFDSLGFSGTQYSQAIRAFLFLGLIDANRRPTEKLKQLVMRIESQRKEVLKSLLE